jgi:hypothetical protein
MLSILIGVPNRMTLMSLQSCAWKFSFQKLKIVLMNQEYHKLLIRNQKKK